MSSSPRQRISRLSAFLRFGISAFPGLSVSAFQRFGVSAFLLFALCACEPADQRPQSSSSSTTSAPDAASSRRWQRINDSNVIAIDIDDVKIQRQLDAAMADARSTLDDARQRWSVAKPDERALWAVKWAAPLPLDSSNQPSVDSHLPSAHGQQPTIDSLNEHVWVQPINWSPFRIEGVLLSQPIRLLDCGRNAGELVSFPVDELADWLHYAADPATNPEAPFEGGFTVKAPGAGVRPAVTPGTAPKIRMPHTATGLEILLCLDSAHPAISCGQPGHSSRTVNSWRIAANLRPICTYWQDVPARFPQ